MPKRAPASSAQAEDAPPILDDATVATVAMVETDEADEADPVDSIPSRPADSEEVALVRSMKWKGFDEVIVRSITGEASIEDYETIHMSGFSDRLKLEREQRRIRAVAKKRLVAVPNKRLEELRVTAEKTGRRVEFEISSEQQRFARLKAEHEAKIEGLKNERATASKAYDSAYKTRMELRNLVPSAVKAVWTTKAVAINTQFRQGVLSKLGTRIHQYERTAQLRLPQDRDAIRLAVLSSHSPLFNPAFQATENFIGDKAHEVNKWVAEVQARLSAELPQMRQEHNRLSALQANAEADNCYILDYYLPVE